jgi:glycosidase
MSKRKKLAYLVPLVILLLAISHTGAAQGLPEVSKVEPPNWWAHHSINPVRVLIHGKNLSGARVEAPSSSKLRTGNVSVNEAGTYLFVDVTIDPQTKPDRYALRVMTASGIASAPFEIAVPLPRSNRFQGFTVDDVIYLIMPDRFDDGDRSNNNPAVSPGLYDRRKKRYYHGGDFAGIIKRLPYLKDLGITAIWLNPIYDNVNHLNEREQYDEGAITDYHGYGAVDFYGVEEHFGTLAQLRELVDRAHALGIKVIQDEVANHTGPYHTWAQDGAPTPTWYNGTVAKHLVNPFTPWMLMDERAAYPEKQATLEGWFINVLPDLNQNDAETARYEIQNTLWWIGITGFDGIRQDTLPYVPRAFWRNWEAAIKREYPQVNVVGEVYDGDPALISFFQGGRARFDGVDSGVDTIFDFPLLYALRHAFAEGKPVREVAQTLARDHLYPNPNVLVTFLGNHDMLRFMNEPRASIAGLKLAQTFLLTTRGIPQLYYGDEIALQGGEDPDNRRDFPGGFPDDARNAFTKEGRTFDEEDVFQNVRRLTRIRAANEPLRRGALVNLFLTDQQYAYARTTPRATVIVALNNDTKPATIDFSIAAAANLKDGAPLTDHLGKVTDARIQNSRLKINLPARSASILTAQ